MSKKVKTAPKPIGHTERAIRKAIGKLEECLRASYDEDTIGGKAIEVGVRLVAQLIVTDFRHTGYTDTDIADQLEEVGVPTSSTSIGRYFVGRHSPQPERLSGLLKLYKTIGTGFQKARRASLAYPSNQ